MRQLYPQGLASFYLIIEVMIQQIYAKAYWGADGICFDGYFVSTVSIDEDIIDDISRIK